MIRGWKQKKQKLYTLSECHNIEIFPLAEENRFSRTHKPNID